MFESLHKEKKRSEPNGSHGERDVKIEQLLLTGLDHYFRGHYELAIDVWTRVLFFERTHARARAYIARARSALAEGLRESEECLHTGVEAFNRGDVDEARDLLRSAIERGGGRDEALAFLDRLNRLETAGGKSTETEVRRRANQSRPEVADLPSRVEPVRSGRSVSILVLFGLVTAGICLALVWGEWGSIFVESPAPRTLAPAVRRNASLPLLSITEVVLLRAERLAADGRGRDALALMASIGPGDSGAVEANELRTMIQRKLLADKTAVD